MCVEFSACGQDVASTEVSKRKSKFISMPDQLLCGNLCYWTRSKRKRKVVPVDLVPGSAG